MDATMLTIADSTNCVTLDISIGKRTRENFWDWNQCRLFEGTYTKVSG